MDGDSANERQPDVNIAYELHPRVLFRVSDHVTRVKANATSSQMEIEQPTTSASITPCYTAVGCLLGEQQGRVVEISNSFDLPSMDFDLGLFQNKVDLYKEMYPTIEVVGWYVTMPKDAEPGEEHVDLHARLVATGCPSQVVMAYDPRPSPVPGQTNQKTTENALRFFEAEEHSGRTVFRLANHELHSSDVERIVVNQFSDLLAGSDDTTTNKTSAAMKNHQEYLRSAVSALIERVTRLRQVLIGIKEGRLEYDEGVVMAIAAFVDRLPLSQDGMSLARSSAPSEQLVEEQKDALLKMLIATTMAGLASLETHTSFDAGKLFAQEERAGKQGHGHHHQADGNFILGS